MLLSWIFDLSSRAAQKAGAGLHPGAVHAEVTPSPALTACRNPELCEAPSAHTKAPQPFKARALTYLLP